MSGALGVMVGLMSGAAGIINGALPDVSNPVGVLWSLQNDGTYSHSGPLTGNWVTPANAVVAAYYQVKVDITAGSLSSGTTGSWLDLSTTRTWTANAGASAVVTVSIREKATGIVRSVQTGIVIDAA